MSSGSKGIFVYESTDCRIVVPGLEVIEIGFFVVVVAAVTEGVNLFQSSGCGEDIAPGVVGVLGGGLVGDRVVDTVESTVAGVGVSQDAFVA